MSQEQTMTEFPAVLIALACPIGMAAMMLVPVLRRRFHWRSPIAADSGDLTPAGRRGDRTSAAT
jgi:hypothetical protein